MSMFQRIKEFLFGPDIEPLDEKLYEEGPTATASGTTEVSEMGSTGTDATIEPAKSPEVTSTTKAKFEIYKGEDKDFYFRLKAPNGKIVAIGEGYSDKRGAQRGIAAVKKYAAKAKVEVLV